MGWIGVDLDGTLAHYDDDWKGVDHIGAPNPLMVDRVKRWLQAGIEVRIFTARISGGEALRVTNVIERWCEKHLGEKLAVTNTKDFDMIELWDDRAVSVETNTGRMTSGLPSVVTL